MEDIASLGLAVDSKPVAKAANDLDDLSKSANKAENATDRYGVASNKAATATNKLGSTAKLAVTAFAALGAAFSVDLLTRAADTYTQFTNRLTVAGIASEDLAAVQERLFAAANAGGQSIDAVGQLYARASLASDTLGASQEQLLQFVDGVTASLKVNGGSAESSAGAILQLSQALGAGTIRAEEFNSILEGAPTIAQAAANGIDETGGSVARLRAMILEGEISSKQFFDGFLIGAEEMKVTAEGLSLTVGNAMTVLSNGFVLFIGSLDQATGASAFAASAIAGIGTSLAWLGQNLGMVVEALLPLAPLFLATFGPVVLGYVLTLTSAIAVGLYGAISTLLALLIANPLTAFIAALVVVLGYMIDWEKSIHALINAWAIFMVEWYRFFGDLDAANGVITIAIDAKQAVSDLASAGENLAAKAKEGIDFGASAAAPKLRDGVSAGGDAAAAKIGAAMTMTAERAAAQWEALNGKVVQEFKNALGDGSTLLYNSVTGAIQKASATIDNSFGAGGDYAGDKMLQSFNSGGENAGQAIGRHMSSAGQAFGSEILEMIDYFANITGDAMRTLSYLEQAISATIDVMEATAAEMRASAINLIAQSKLAEAQAKLARSQALNPGRGGAGYGGGGGGGGGNVFTNPLGLLGERGTALGLRSDTRNTTAQGSRETAPVNVSVPVTNIIDPGMIPQAISTAAGTREVINLIAANRDEINSVLGVT